MPEAKRLGKFARQFFFLVLSATRLRLRENRVRSGMNAPAERHEFASDNTAAICPEAWAQLQAANDGGAVSYGDDRWTARVRDSVREIFETDCEVF